MIVEEELLMAEWLTRDKEQRALIQCCFLEQAFTSWVSFLLHSSDKDCYSLPFHCRIPDKLYVLGRQKSPWSKINLKHIKLKEKKVSTNKEIINAVH